MLKDTARPTEAVYQNAAELGCSLCAKVLPMESVESITRPSRLYGYVGESVMFPWETLEEYENVTGHGTRCMHKVQQFFVITVMRHWLAWSFHDYAKGK